MADPSITDRIYEEDRLKLRLADYRLALAQSEARTAAALYEAEKLRIMWVYHFKEGETVNSDTGLIARVADG